MVLTLLRLVGPISILCLERYICEEAMVERVIKCAEDTQNYYNEQDKAK